MDGGKGLKFQIHGVYRSGSTWYIKWKNPVYLSRREWKYLVHRSTEKWKYLANKSGGARYIGGEVSGTYEWKYPGYIQGNLTYSTLVSALSNNFTKFNFYLKLKVLPHFFIVTMRS
jgi:hypothetical protein